MILSNPCGLRLLLHKKKQSYQLTVYEKLFGFCLSGFVLLVSVCNTFKQLNFPHLYYLVSEIYKLIIIYYFCFFNYKIINNKNLQ